MEKRLNESQDSRGGLAEGCAERYRCGVTFEEAQNKLRGLLNENGVAMLKNDSDGEVVRLSRSSIGKLMSEPAVKKSISNGFTREQHYAVASDIGELFKGSLKLYEHADAAGNLDVTMHRFATPLGNRDDVAYITVKESRVHGKRLYSVELIEMGKLAGILEDVRGPNPRADFPSTQTSLRDNIAKLLAAVKKKDKNLSDPTDDGFADTRADVER